MGKRSIYRKVQGVSFDVDVYEALRKEAEKTNTDVSALINKLAIEKYRIEIPDRKNNQNIGKKEK